MRSDKPTENPRTGIKISSFGDKKYASCVRETPIGVEKCLLPQSGTGPDFLAKMKNQSISVINNFLSRSLKKNLNGKKLDFYILKGLDQ